ncbi:MAG TPA: tetratricopeptide repeat protein [Gemmataceae bacterium]|nr:tetratricopeptide repeat protein [Gemmataceae bacterium]
MLRLRNRRARIVLAVAVLLLLGVAAYFIGVSVWANGQHQAALQALEHYDFEKAGQHLEKYLSVRPQDPEILLLAAQTARRRGEFTEAVRQVRAAEEAGAATDAIATERQLLRIQTADLTDASRLVQYCTDHAAEAQTALVYEALIEGSLKAVNPALAQWAVDLWLKHRTGKVDQAQGLVLRGRVHEFLQDMPQALADFRKALELVPEHLPARLRLAEVLIREAPAEAAPQVEWLQRHRPQDPEVRFLGARLHRNLGRPEEASRLLDAILATTPDKIPVLLERARVAMELHRPQDAERWLLRALSLAPMQREVNLALSDCLRQAGRLAEARRYQDRLAEIDANLKKRLDELTRKAKTAGGPPGG